MAESKKTDTDDTEKTDSTAEAANPKVPRAKKTAKDAAKPVLVFNAHGGPYVGAIVRDNPNIPKGAAKKDPKLAKQIEKVVMYAGLALLTGEQYLSLSKGDGFTRRVARHDLVILNEPDEDWADAWDGQRVRVCREQIKNTTDREVLKMLLEGESRDDLIEALEAQLEATQSDAKGRASARSMQRRLNRGRARRAATGGPVGRR